MVPNIRVEGGGKFALTKVDNTSMDQVTIKNAAIIGDGLNTRDYYDYTYLALLKRWMFFQTDLQTNC